MTIARLSSIPILPKMLKGCSLPVLRSGSIARGLLMKASRADTGVPDPRMKEADQTNRWRVKRGEEASNLDNHARTLL
jgi:hypothetical protein